MGKIKSSVSSANLKGTTKYNSGISEKRCRDKNFGKGLGCSSVLEHFPRMPQA